MIHSVTDQNKIPNIYAGDPDHQVEGRGVGELVADLRRILNPLMGEGEWVNNLNEAVTGAEDFDFIIRCQVPGSSAERSVDFKGKAVIPSCVEVVTILNEGVRAIPETHCKRDEIIRLFSLLAKALEESSGGRKRPGGFLSEIGGCVLV